MTCPIALLVGALVVKCLLNGVAPVEQDVCPGAKQVKVPVLFLAIGVASDVASDIAIDNACGAGIEVPAIRVDRQFLHQCPVPVVQVDRGDETSC
jgi:hypothetical protein